MSFNLREKLQAFKDAISNMRERDVEAYTTSTFPIHPQLADEQQVVSDHLVDSVNYQYITSDRLRGVSGFVGTSGGIGGAGGAGGTWQESYSIEGGYEPICAKPVKKLSKKELNAL